MDYKTEDFKAGEKCNKSWKGDCGCASCLDGCLTLRSLFSGLMSVQFAIPTLAVSVQALNKNNVTTKAQKTLCYSLTYYTAVECSKFW